MKPKRGIKKRTVLEKKKTVSSKANRIGSKFQKMEPVMKMEISSSGFGIYLPLNRSPLLQVPWIG